MIKRIAGRIAGSPCPQFSPSRLGKCETEEGSRLPNRQEVAVFKVLEGGLKRDCLEVASSSFS